MLNLTGIGHIRAEMAITLMGEIALAAAKASNMVAPAGVVPRQIFSDSLAAASDQNIATAFQSAVCVAALCLATTAST